MGTIWGYHYTGGGFDCNLVLDYSSSENIAGNYSTVNWAVRIAGNFPERPPGYRNWIMGSWDMSMGGWASSSIGWHSIGGILGGWQSVVLDSGSFNIGHDGNGNSAIPINFNSTLLYHNDVDSEYVAWNLPQIDRSYATVSLQLIKNTPYDATIRITNNYPCRVVFNNNLYYIRDYNSHVDVPITGLTPNTAYEFGTHGIWNLNNNLPTPDPKNPTIKFHTDGRLDTSWRTFDVTVGQTFAKINNLPAYLKDVNNERRFFSIGGGNPVSLNSSGEITGLNYHTTYVISILRKGTYWLGNQETPYTITSPTFTITTKYRLPIIQANLANTTVGTAMTLTAGIRNTVGCQNAYKYTLTLTGSNGDKQVFSSTKYLASYQTTYTGAAGVYYTLKVTAVDSDRQITVQDCASIVCGSQTVPSMTSAVEIVPYIYDIKISGISYELFSTGKIIEEVLSGTTKIFSKETSAPIGQGNISNDYVNLLPNHWYTIIITIIDANGNKSYRQYEEKTYPLSPKLDANEIQVIGKPTAHGFKVKWNPISETGYSVGLTYGYTLKDASKTWVTTQTQALSIDFQKDYSLTPETVYTLEVTPKNGFTYKPEDINTYTIAVKTEADVWLKLHKDGEAAGTFNRYKIYLINSTYPLGLELKKPGVKVIK
jgi:hypothetical protein